MSRATFAGTCASVPTVHGTPARQNAASRSGAGNGCAHAYYEPDVFSSTMRPPAAAASAMAP